MDSTARNTYVHVMLGRFATMLAMLAIAVVTTMTPAHAVRMNAGLDHPLLGGEMMHVTDHGEGSCTDPLQCGDAESSMCAFVCAGFSAFLPFLSAETGQECRPSRRLFPPEANSVGRAPGLNERPPQHRLL